MDEAPREPGGGPAEPPRTRTARVAESFLGLAFLLPFLLFVHAVAWAPVGVDAGYYLGSVERMAEGSVPCRDLGMAYPPLGLYALLGVRLFAGAHAGYGAYLGLVVLVEALCALLVYLLARRIVPNRLAAGGWALLAWILFYLHDGVVIILEPFTALFALLAVAACFAFSLRQAQGPEGTRGAAPWAFALAGALAGAAFLSKQYGLAALPPVALYALLADPGAGFGRVRSLLFVLAGFALPLAAFAGAFAFLGVAPGVLVSSLSGTGYERWGLAEAVSAFGRFVFPQNLYLLAVPLLLFDRETRRDARFWMILAMFALFLLPLYARPYPHYFLLVIPFAALLGVYALALGLRRRRLLPFVAATALASLLSAIFIAQDDGRKNVRHWNRAAQAGTAAVVNSLLPRGTPVVALDFAEPFLWLCDLAPPEPRRLGYAFPRAFPPADRRIALERSKAALLIPPLMKPDDPWFAELKAAGFRYEADAGQGVEVWIKRPRPPGGAAP